MVNKPGPHAANKLVSHQCSLIVIDFHGCFPVFSMVSAWCFLAFSSLFHAFPLLSQLFASIRLENGAWQHVRAPLHQVDRGAALRRLAIDGRVGVHEVRHVGDVDAHPEVAVGQRLAGDRVVDVLASGLLTERPKQSHIYIYYAYMYYKVYCILQRVYLLYSIYTIYTVLVIPQSACRLYRDTN